MRYSMQELVIQLEFREDAEVTPWLVHQES